MEDWKLGQLKAHQQFTLGRLDAFRWCVDRLDSLHEEEADEDLTILKEKIRDLEATSREVDGYIGKIFAARDAVKQKRLDEQAAVHERFKEKQRG